MSNTTLWVLTILTVFFTAVLIGVRYFFPMDAVMMATFSTLLGGFSGALLRHINDWLFPKGGSPDAPAPVSTEVPTK